MNLLEIRQKNRNQITRSLTALSFMEQAIATLNSFAQKDLRKGDEEYEEIITAQDLDHLLSSLAQVRGNTEVIELREHNIEKYREYFLEFQRWEPLLQEINALLKELRAAKLQISFSLRFTEYFCLVNSSLAVPESEQSFKECLYDSSYAIEDRITAGLELAQYYINNSKYGNSLQCLSQVYQLIQISLSKKDYFLGYYHLLTAHCFFYQMHLVKAHREFLIAKNHLTLALQDENTKEANFRMQTCLHYMGRNYNTYFNLNQAINHYVDAQKMFEDIWNKFSLPYRTAATAFYHLRMADALAALKISRSARFHYQESLRLFEKSKSKAIAQTRLSEIKRMSQEDFPELISSHELFLEKERRYQQEILNVIEMDYKRGEIEGLTWLLQLYIQHLKFKPVWKTIKRLHKFQTVNDQYSFTNFWFLVCSMLCWDVIAPIYIHRFLRFVKPDFLLTECPCDECRSRQF